MELFEEKPCLNVCAPMVRYSKLPFRELVRNYNVDIAYNPMILADVFRSSSDYSRQHDFTTNARDCPVVIQFAANNSDDFASAAVLAEPFVDAVDLNCGCPQPWAFDEKIGAYLLEKPELVHEIVKTVRRRTNLPCTVKIRVHDNDRVTDTLVRGAERMGVSWITVHGRTRKQKSTEYVSREKIKFVKESVGIPVIANGNVFSLDDAVRLHQETRVNGVMSARGLLRNPMLFAGELYPTLDCIEKFVVLAMSYGMTNFIFHHHLIFMFDSLMTAAEKRTFNCLTNIPTILDYLETHYGICARGFKDSG